MKPNPEAFEIVRSIMGCLVDVGLVDQIAEEGIGRFVRDHYDHLVKTKMQTVAYQILQTVYHMTLEEVDPYYEEEGDYFIGIPYRDLFQEKGEGMTGYPKAKVVMQGLEDYCKITRGTFSPAMVCIDYNGGPRAGQFILTFDWANGRRQLCIEYDGPAYLGFTRGLNELMKSVGAPKRYLEISFAGDAFPESGGLIFATETAVRRAREAGLINAPPWVPLIVNEADPVAREFRGIVESVKSEWGEAVGGS